MLDQLGHRVLQQRKAAGLIVEVAHDPLDQTRLEVEAHGEGWLRDRSCETDLIGHGDRHQARFEHCPELGMLQRPIVEVRPHRHHDPQPRARV